MGNVSSVDELSGNVLAYALLLLPTYLPDWAKPSGGSCLWATGGLPLSTCCCSLIAYFIREQGREGIKAKSNRWDER